MASKVSQSVGKFFSRLSTGSGTQAPTPSVRTAAQPGGASAASGATPGSRPRNPAELAAPRPRTLVPTEREKASRAGAVSRFGPAAREVGLNAAAIGLGLDKLVQGGSTAGIGAQTTASNVGAGFAMAVGITQAVQGAAEVRLADRKQADAARLQMRLEGLALAEGESSAGRLKSAFEGLKAALPQAQHKRLDALHDKLKVGSADRARRYVSTMFHSGRHESPLLNQDRSDFIHLLLEKEVKQAAQGLQDRRLNPEQARAFVDELKDKLTRLKADETGRTWQKLRMPEGFMAEGEGREQALQSVHQSFQSGSLRQKIKNTLGGRDSNLQEALKRLAIDAKAQDKLERLESFVDWYAQAQDSSLQKDVQQLFHFAGGPLARLNKDNGTAYTRAHQRQNMREQLLWNLASYVHEQQAAGTLDTNAFARHVRALADSLKPSMNLGEHKVPNARQRHPLVDLHQRRAGAASAAQRGDALPPRFEEAILDLFTRSTKADPDATLAKARDEYLLGTVRAATGMLAVAGGAAETAGIPAGFPVRIAGPLLLGLYAAARSARETTRDKGLVDLQRRHANEIDRAKADHGIGAQKDGEAAPQKQRDYLYRLLDLAQEGNSYAMNILIREQLRYEQDLLSQKDVPQEQVQLTTLFRRMEVPDADIKEFVRAREAGRPSE